MEIWRKYINNRVIVRIIQTFVIIVTSDLQITDC